MTNVRPKITATQIERALSIRQNHYDFSNHEIEGELNINAGFKMNFNNALFKGAIKIYLSGNVYSIEFKNADFKESIYIHTNTKSNLDFTGSLIRNGLTIEGNSSLKLNFNNCSFSGGINIQNFTLEGAHFDNVKFLQHTESDHFFFENNNCITASFIESRLMNAF